VKLLVEYVVKSKKNEYTQEEQTQSAKQIRMSMEKNAGSPFLLLKRSSQMKHQASVKFH
jgi:hypothetical protein